MGLRQMVQYDIIAPVWKRGMAQFIKFYPSKTPLPGPEDDQAGGISGSARLQQEACNRGTCAIEPLLHLHVHSTSNTPFRVPLSKVT